MVAEGGGVPIERREAHRLPVHVRGFVRRHSDPKPTPVQVVNLSVTGCLIAGWTAPPRTPARLELDLQDGQAPLALRIMVMRQTHVDGMPGAGVRFEEPYPVSAETRLTKFLRGIERAGARTRMLREEEDDAP
jgi:hypothetical protein